MTVERIRDPRVRLERRLSFLTTLVHPADQPLSHVESLKFSKGGVSTREQYRESIKVVNEAIAAVRGVYRLINSGGIVEGGKVEWRRLLVSDDPNDCVEFTVILR